MIGVAAWVVVVAAAPVASHARLQLPPAGRGATISHPIVAGENLATILQRYGVPAAEVAEWYQAARSHRDLRTVGVGRSMTLSFGASRRLAALRYQVNDEWQLVVERLDGARLAARWEATPVRVRVVGVRGVIRDSFYLDARRAGVPDRIISDLVDLLSWELDFQSDVHPGDRFRVLYEHRVGVDGRPLTPGRILAADFVGRRRSTALFLYEDGNGNPVHLNEQGQPLERSLLRYPLEFTRITSTFSYSRFHPTLKRRRPHLGVDFAAPAGTPVRAIGAGRVRWAAWRGSLGRHVEIDHGDGFVSAYSHLRGIRQGVRRGARVLQGQIIGWVGRTGLATGSHLHFAVFDKGRYVNPLKMQRRAPLADIDPYKFDLVRTALTRRLQGILGTYRPAPSTPPIFLSALAQARRLGPVILTL